MPINVGQRLLVRRRKANALALVCGFVSLVVMSNSAFATEEAGLAPGEWHRRTLIDPPATVKKVPMLANLLSRPMESSLCISPARAAQGPIAVALADDRSNCRVVDFRVAGKTFSARRVCHSEAREDQTFFLKGTFTSTTLTFNSTSHNRSGEEITSQTSFINTGPCRVNDIKTR